MRRCWHEYYRFLALSTADHGIRMRFFAAYRFCG